MDTARNLCANGVKGGETNTDHADPSQNRTPRSINLSSLTLRTEPCRLGCSSIHQSFFLDASNCTRDGTVPKQSSDWSFIDRLIDLSCSNLLLHARRRGWPEARN